MSSPRLSTVVDLPDSTTNELYRNISSDGEIPDAQQHGIEAYIDIRPTADMPAAKLTKFQIAMMVARFMIGANTANMSPPVTLPQPFASSLDWGFMNIGIESGTAAFKGASRHWMDTVNILRNEGNGNAALGLTIGAAKVLVACIPSALIGLAVGALPLGVLGTIPLSRIIAALISPWIYIATKKLIDHYFPAQEYQCNTAPPLNELQYAAMLGFSIFDAVNIYEFARILIKAYGPEEILRHPHFALGVVPLYLLLSNVIDPIAFGHSKLYGPPPFAAPVTDEELGITETDEPILIVEDEMASELDHQVQEAVRHQLQQEVTHANLQNAAVYAACATLAFGAGLLADLAAAKLLGDTTLLSNSVRKLGVAFTCTCAAVTQVVLVNNAPAIISTAKNCWASLFHRREDATIHETESLLDDIERGHRPPPPNFRPATPDVLIPSFNSNN